MFYYCSYDCLQVTVRWTLFFELIRLSFRTAAIEFLTLRLLIKVGGVGSMILFNWRFPTTFITTMTQLQQQQLLFIYKYINNNTNFIWYTFVQRLSSVKMWIWQFDPKIVTELILALSCGRKAASFSTQYKVLWIKLAKWKESFCIFLINKGVNCCLLKASAQKKKYLTVSLSLIKTKLNKSSRLRDYCLGIRFSSVVYIATIRLCHNVF